MTNKGIGLAAGTLLVLAGCATNQGTPTHRMSVELVGAESAECVSPQAIGDYAITAPGDILVEPEAPNVEVICNAEGYQETYASFEEVYNDGSAGMIVLGALVFGVMGAAMTAGSDGLDSLPERVTITMVPDGEIHTGSLAHAEYEKASETLVATASLAPAYTTAEPPEDSAIAQARAKALTSGDQVAAARARDAELRQFEARLRGNRAQLTAMLNNYNRETEFARSSHTGIRLKIKDVSRVDVVQGRDDGYVVRFIGNSTSGTSFTDEVYDELFLIDDSRGGLRVLAHGAKLKDGRQQPQIAASAGSENAADIRHFEARLKGNTPQLVRLLNEYNGETEFARSQHNGAPLKIKDVFDVTVLDANDRGYVVRLRGNSGLSAASWSDDVYDELFLIDNRRGGLRILGHGRQLAERQSRATG